MSMNNLYLISSGLSLALAPTVLGELLRHFRSRQGNQLVVYRAFEQSGKRFLEIVRGKFSKGERRSESVVLNELRLVDDGNAIIENVDLTLKVAAAEGLLGAWPAELIDPLKEMTCEKVDDCVRLRRPFINSRHSYKKEKITLRIRSNTNLRFSVVGGGPNWYATFEDRSLPEGDIHCILLGSAVVMILSFIVFGCRVLHIFTLAAF